MSLRRHRRALLSGAGLLVAFAALVVLASTHSSPQHRSAPAAAHSTAATEAVRVAPLALTSVDGQPIRLPAGRPGALFFTVSGCTSCLASAQALAQVKTSLGSRVDAAYISIDPHDAPADVRARRDSLGNPPYPFAIDATGTLYQQYRVTALGTTLIYDSQGRIVDTLIEPGRAQLEAAFRKTGVT